MLNWKLSNLKTKLRSMGIHHLGGDRYLDEGTGQIITEKQIEALAVAAGKQNQPPETEIPVSNRGSVEATATCRNCGSRIAWEELVYSKRWKPINVDGSAHKCGMVPKSARKP